MTSPELTYTGTDQERDATRPNIPPRRVEWTGPEGWTLWADEDGVHIRTPKGDALEQNSALELVNLYHDLLDTVRGNKIPAPVAPSREQIHQMGADYQAAYYAKRVERAVRTELAPDTDPF